MAQPDSTGEAIQILRRVLYDLSHQPNWKREGATQLEIINYAIGRSWPVPVRDFQKAMDRLIAAKAAEEQRPWGIADSARVTLSRYRLTAGGDLEEEDKRRPWIKHVWDEMRGPKNFVQFLLLLAGFALGLISGLLLRAPSP